MDEFKRAQRLLEHCKEYHYPVILPSMNSLDCDAENVLQAEIQGPQQLFSWQIRLKP